MSEIPDWAVGYRPDELMDVEITPGELTEPQQKVIDAYMIKNPNAQVYPFAYSPFLKSISAAVIDPDFNEGEPFGVSINVGE